MAADESLVVVETGARQVSRIDLVTGESTPLIEGILSVPGPALMPPPFILDDVAVDEAGSIYVKTSEGLTRFDPRG